ncbi:MBL fold metallo-hydrolase [Sphingomonas oligophenolica]|uniref:MBL fold metallo-hydrolase n=1 Tax=Sphingomonas oligophenolica TaxID=301154 RepID=A0ABU9XX46_9SPHN
MIRALPLAIALILAAGPAGAQPAPAAGGALVSHWITLGTRGGPIAEPERSQPANALLAGNTTYLIDVGDGTVEQLAKAGVPLASVKVIFLSHLHFDHTAGLFGVLGLRWQTNVDSPLTIYGPPGTRTLVDSLVAAMEPTTRSGYGMPGAQARPAGAGIAVVEIRDGARLDLGAIKVSAVKNTHYSFPAGSAEDLAFQSLALRFDMPDRSIVYTGDTGPSPAVEKLAQGADLLVSEMIDVDRTMADVRLTSPNADPRATAAVEAHLRAHHLAPEDVGKLAGAAHVKAVVVTHFVAPRADAGTLLGFLARIRDHFSGPATIARDLESF